MAGSTGKRRSKNKDAKQMISTKQKGEEQEGEEAKSMTKTARVGRETQWWEEVGGGRKAENEIESD